MALYVSVKRLIFHTNFNIACVTFIIFRRTSVHNIRKCTYFLPYLLELALRIIITNINCLHFVKMSHRFIEKPYRQSFISATATINNTNSL